MNTKPIQIDAVLHRETAVRSAMSGETMRSITERAIRRELERLARKETRKLAATSEGSPAGA